MNNLWVEFIGGIITVEIRGKGIERLINTFTRNGILIWHVKRHGTESVTIKMRLKDVHKIRPIIRGSECKVTFLRRTGIPFLFKRLIKNSGFIIGAAAFLLVIFLLSNMVWGIEIKGAGPETEHKIRKELDEIGVEKGKLQFLLENVEGIQRHLSNQIEEITWVGVELKGTTFHFQVVEKNEPEQPEYASPGHLVAKKKGVIVDMFIEEGQPIVSIHDHVKPGQLLVSGEIGKEGKTEIVAAKGEVFAETWYKTDVKYSLKRTFQVFNGNEKQKHFIGIGDWQMPIWGFGKVEYQEFETEYNKKNFRFLKWELPISYTHTTIREREQETKILTNEEAFAAAKVEARNDIRNKLNENDKIKGEKVLHKSVEDGKVILSIHFQIIENIAVAQPLIQGETE
ncbi:hypothetical protein J2Z40_002242 [Cytobacillus eiseniae]|uniref:Sporulation protein YqfD n=1 Tax=Cytobacillus eiseniae TaxID=762947 RepID=A0ABS4RFJ5_9BACI|nr:sporulation protein YqfD [Cytobacillus eiseniae]MBP2241670.1 hypothetical protein [Cytobacillus eiseniae]